MCCTIEQDAIHLLGRATLTQQLRDITHPLAHASTQTPLGAQQNMAQRTSGASKLTEQACDITRPPAICSRGQFSCTTGQSPRHYQGGRLSQSQPVVSHTHWTTCSARAFLDAQENMVQLTGRMGSHHKASRRYRTAVGPRATRQNRAQFTHRAGSFRTASPRYRIAISPCVVH